MAAAPCSRAAPAPTHPPTKPALPPPLPHPPPSGRFRTACPPARLAAWLQDVPILTADALDSVSVGAMLAQASVVLSTVGPFARYGNTILEQSVEQGTHYCDITGESTEGRRGCVCVCVVRGRVLLKGGKACIA